MIIGRQFAEKFYSETVQEEEEKLYSTGNDELDELLERAFCEGYEYAQKEFAEEGEKKEKNPENHRGLGRAYMLGGVGAMAGRSAGKAQVKKSIKEGKDLDEAEREGMKKAGKVGAAAGAGTLAVAATPGVIAANKVIKAAKPKIKEALKEAGIKVTKKNKRIAAIGAGVAGATALGAAATYGSAGAKIGMDKNNRERRRRMEKNQKSE